MKRREPDKTSDKKGRDRAGCGPVNTKIKSVEDLIFSLPRDEQAIVKKLRTLLFDVEPALWFRMVYHTIPGTDEYFLSGLHLHRWASRDQRHHLVFVTGTCSLMNKAYCSVKAANKCISSGSRHSKRSMSLSCPRSSRKRCWRTKQCLGRKKNRVDREWIKSEYKDFQKDSC